MAGASAANVVLSDAISVAKARDVKISAVPRLRRVPHSAGAITARCNAPKVPNVLIAVKATAAAPSALKMRSASTIASVMIAHCGVMRALDVA